MARAVVALPVSEPLKVKLEKKAGKFHNSSTPALTVRQRHGNWVAAQKEDPELHTVLQWLKSKKKTDLRTLLWEHTSSEGGLDGIEKLPKFHYPLRYPLPTLHPKRRE